MARQTAPINQNRKKSSSATKNNTSVSRQTKTSTPNHKGLMPTGNNDMLNEIIMIAAIALCFITLLSLFTKSTGAFGEAVREITFGFFGFCAYLIPFTIIFYCGYLLVKNKKIDTFKLIISITLFVFISAFMHLLSNTEYESMKFVQYIMRHYNEGSWKNGGLLGAAVGDFFVGAFGKVGAYVLIAALFIICFILISGKSFFSIIGIVLNSTKPAIKKVAAKSTRAISQKQKTYKPEKEKPKNVVDISELYENYEDEEQEPWIDEIQSFDGYEEEQPEKIPYMPVTKSRRQEFNIPFNEKKSEPIYEDYKPKEESAAEKSKEPKILSEPTNSDEYIFPPIELLQKIVTPHSRESKEQTLKNAKKLEETLGSFGVDAKVLQINRGPTVTRYELTPKQGVKVSKIVNLSDDIALNLAAAGIRIEAPIPGKAAVGIEIPNKEAQSVFLREVIEDEVFVNFPSKLAFGVGKDIAGTSVVTDIAKMPHLLIAGATGSGKSVCINTIITSILYKSSPNEVKLLMIDPKVVELSIYNGIPHLLIPVVTDPKKASGALHWAVQEMGNRYNLFAEYNVRDMKGYNQALTEKGEGELLPQIVIIIDELADLMMAAPREVEDSICRLAQMARAAGLHLIIATQRPSVDVITGVIKANIPSRLAFAVSSGVDSRTILDMVGAEKLLGKGDMLFYPSGIPKPIRVQGAFVSDKEVESIVSFIKQRHYTEVDQSKINEITSPGKNPVADENSDEFFEEAVTLLVEKEKASTSMLQRQFRIGYNRASRLMEELEARGIVGPEDGSKPRKVLLTKKELKELRQEK